MERCYSLHPCSSPFGPPQKTCCSKLIQSIFSHERSEPLAAYRARIVPYNPFAFPPSMEVSVGCNPSRPTIYSPSRHCRFQIDNSSRVVEPHVSCGFQCCMVNLYQMSYSATFSLSDTGLLTSPDIKTIVTEALHAPR
jgi:hypothetical protein